MSSHQRKIHLLAGIIAVVLGGNPCFSASVPVADSNGENQAVVFHAEKPKQHSGSKTDVILRDKLGNKIGSIETRSDGIQIGRDKLSNKVGEYDPKRDITRDKLGNKFGEGNLLAVLITQASK